MVQDNAEMLFGKEDRLNINLPETFWSDDEKVTEEENEWLDQEFTEEEIKSAVFQSYAEAWT